MAAATRERFTHACTHDHTDKRLAGISNAFGSYLEPLKLLVLVCVLISHAHSDSWQAGGQQTTNASIPVIDRFLVIAAGCYFAL